MTFVSPDALKLGDDVNEYLREKEMPFSETEKLEEVLPNIDVLYMTRIQQERFEDKSVYEKVKDCYVLTIQHVQTMKPEARIFHPLPRVNEIALEVDKDSRAAYFRQAHNGLPVRMALLEMLIAWCSHDSNFRSRHYSIDFLINFNIYIWFFFKSIY